jgi:nitrogen fixation NifU-like protein
MPKSNGCSRVTGGCGDTLAVWLKVTDNVITEASFEVEGCAATIACGSMVTELARGKSLTEALALDEPALIDALGGLPEGNRHCATLAVETLRQAVRDYLAYRREPWRRAYHKS